MLNSHLLFDSLFKFMQLTPTFTGSSAKFFCWWIPYSGRKFFPCCFIWRYVIGKFITAIFVFLFVTSGHTTPHKLTTANMKTKTTQKDTPTFRKIPSPYKGTATNKSCEPEVKPISTVPEHVVSCKTSSPRRIAAHQDRNTHIATYFQSFLNCIIWFCREDNHENDFWTFCVKMAIIKLNGCRYRYFLYLIAFLKLKTQKLYALVELQHYKYSITTYLQEL